MKGMAPRKSHDGRRLTRPGPVARAAMGLFALALALALPVQAKPDAVATRLSAHVDCLASDDFAGRQPGTVGETKTIAYLVRAFTGAGLAPGGELVDGKRSWFQTVPLINIAVTGTPALAFTGPNGIGKVTQGEQIVVRGSTASPARLVLKDAPLVFVGRGIAAPEHQWDDYKGVDLTGKVAIFLSGDPMLADGSRPFGKTPSRYGGYSHHIEQALQRGAAAVLMLHETATAGFEWATTANSFRQRRQDIPRPDAAARSLPLEGGISPETAAALFAAAGLDYPRLRAIADSRDFRPVELPGIGFTAAVAIERTDTSSKSVIGIIPGTSHADETLTYISHWDHIGTDAADKPDRIYNGAIDNATGVATLIEVARTLARRPKPQRSQLFIAVTLEEPGLLGSEYYAAHPLYPLEKTVAVIAFDTMFPMGRARDFSNNAQVESQMTELLVDAGKRQGRRYVAEPHAELYTRVRTDHYPFAKRGVPPVFYMAGEDLIDGGTGPGRGIVSRFFSKDYHQPSDEPRRDWNYAGIAEDVALVADLGSRLANSRQWPEWYEGAPFKAVRDTSKAQRP